ncbi:hypothetical protein MHU86_25885 [Fragilaria crotonensis]|nr:hypothetical protein MHU86_25885 [Fragilaria crotonensis]
MSNSPPALRALGFCGADDSVHPNMLILLAKAYPFVEFGVLFRPDKEGQPRYASPQWVERLVRHKQKLANKADVQLAAHLCGTRVDEVLTGDGAFLQQLQGWGFNRVQINATQVNGVDTSLMQESVPTVLSLIRQYPDLEFILQRNEETKPLWQGILDAGSVPSNVSMLMDESKGTGKAMSSTWPTPPSPVDYEIGYAGGIGPETISNVLVQVIAHRDATGRSVWIDMESRLRSIKNGQDVFDLDKCYDVIDAVCQAGLYSHPEYLS